MTDFIIREGTAQDVPSLLGLIKELAEYERAAQEVTNTEAQLLADGFGQTPLYGFYVAENLVTKQIVGMALYYYRYSTWKGKVFYLEDLYIQPAYRRLGIGEQLFEAIKQHAYQHQCPRITWQVLTWNTPAIQFYEKLGATIDKEWWNGIYVITP